ncbi:hypothetical protein [Undibacterium oligocarboniphilum]|jgi:hypothetical protein|uniref:Uncharacterized protein n=1 Tax=Undibacterium oligocarboniphilum TaxID=666702 RepID=A0A850QIJ0_9BURK|nr:hypothetical protein [Undibacterium oligocarboniphilum]MBC3871485.1 hypothetical protein [Undibacterium oligocarboniphilum]NVO78939.1 hypothetical protein [Undibacterium oligocarboniphilum]
MQQRNTAKRKMLALIIGLAPLAASAHNPAPEPVSVGRACHEKDCSASAGVSRLYLIKNQNGYLVAVSDQELDAPAQIHRTGSAKQIRYQGKDQQVETTLVVRDHQTIAIDRLIATGDNDSE